MMRATMMLVAVLLAGCTDFSGGNADCAKNGTCQAEVKPTIAASTPAANATDVALNTGLSLTFSEAMIRSTVQLSITPVVAIAGPTWVEDGKDTTATWTVAGGLTASTQYTLTVSGQSAKGQQMASPTQLVFTTGAAKDTTPPTVTSTYPATDATGIATDAPISVTFSERMGLSAASAMTISPALPCATTLDTAGVVLTCTHTGQPMQASTKYTVTVGTGAKDEAGNGLAQPYTFTFTTASASSDTTPPTVTASFPAHNAASVAVDTAFTITFSEKMEVAAASAVTVQPNLPCTFGFDQGLTVLTCTHATAMQPGTRYTVTVGTSARDAAGNAMTAPYSFSFQTVVVAPPVIEAVYPPDTTVGVDVGSPISITFSQKMQPAAVSAVTVVPSVACAWGLDTSGTVMTCTHGTPMQYSTAYTVSVSNAARDVNGTALVVGTQFGFTTAAAPDVTPPTVTTIPPNLATNISVSTAIVLQFSEPVDQASLGAIIQPTATLGTPSWSVDGRTATFTPSPALQAQTTYYLALSAQDLAGNALAPLTVQFTTGTPPDTTPPTVITTTPATGTTGVGLTSDITVVFSEPMQPGAIAAFSISNLTCSNAFDSTSTVLTCKHAAALQSNTVYTGTVTVAAKDTAGNALAAPFTFTFTSGAQPDTTPPTVVSTTPASAAVGVQPTATVQVVFSEAMDHVSVEGKLTVTPSGSVTALTGTFGWSADSKTVTFTPSASLAWGTIYNAQVASGAKDTSGNGMVSTKSWSFRTLNRASGSVAADASDLTLSSQLACKVSSSTSTSLVAGFTGVTTPQTEYVGVMTFDLASLGIPAGATLESATLGLRVSTISGTPFPSGLSNNLGTLMVERSDADTISAPGSVCSANCYGGTCTTVNVTKGATAGTWLTPNVLGSLGTTISGKVSFALGFFGYVSRGTLFSGTVGVYSSNSSDQGLLYYRPRLFLTWRYP